MQKWQNALASTTTEHKLQKKVIFSVKFKKHWQVSFINMHFENVENVFIGKSGISFTLAERSLNCASKYQPIDGYHVKSWHFGCQIFSFSVWFMEFLLLFFPVEFSKTDLDKGQWFGYSITAFELFPKYKLSFSPKLKMTNKAIILSTSSTSIH